MAVIALIALVIIGPKDLPKVMRSAAHWARKARGLAREFQSGVDDMIREADMDDARKVVDSARSLDVRKAIGDAVDPTGDLRDEASDIEKTAQDAGTVEKIDGDGEDVAPKTETEVGPEPNIAPPHSLTPPKETAEAPPISEPAGQSTTQSTAADDDAGKQAP